MVCFELWEIAREPRQNQCRNGKNFQAPHKSILLKSKINSAIIPTLYLLYFYAHNNRDGIFII